ncbi:hypothetical protein ebD65 [Aromatoleum aromaticum EbN1]|uniref:Uncharacterized protein n=1 Tax=Aromatoleum aromaticum (strain DSM 19018 / LMG 30748 / EbN1) TaxID=76114 RepID=Q5P511_AROAE|nr:hypothetical protein ebD65 [Aromatoleum aromaticum EbN1]
MLRGCGTRPSGSDSPRRSANTPPRSEGVPVRTRSKKRNQLAAPEPVAGDGWGVRGAGKDCLSERSEASSAARRTNTPPGPGGQAPPRPHRPLSRNRNFGKN